MKILEFNIHNGEQNSLFEKAPKHENETARFITTKILFNFTKPLCGGHTTLAHILSFQKTLVDGRTTHAHILSFHKTLVR